MTIELNKVYDSRTRENLEEVLRSYEVGNYRSALVLLNSVCLSDIFYKLQELRDVYSDAIATKLIQDIESLIEKDKTSPAWERKLVESVFNEMHLLDSAGYTLLFHLHDYRNLTAHPVMDGSSNLYQPSKELVESCIIEAYNTILVKPSIFVKNIVSFMADDLDSKRRYIADDKDGFKTYIEQKYLVHMSEPMLLKVFSSFWKFTFVLTDEACARNRIVNMRLIRLLTEIYKDPIIKEINEHPQNFSLLDNEETIRVMVIYLANHPCIYDKVTDDVKRLIVKRVEDVASYKLVSWFLSDDKITHIQRLIDESFVYTPSERQETSFLKRSFKTSEVYTSTTFIY